MGKTRLNILAVDDERHIARLMQVTLESQGHHVATAHNGEDALRLVKESSFDVLILDYFLPDLDAPEVVLKLRAMPEGADLPIVILLAKTPSAEDHLQMNEWHEAGVICRLMKPLSKEELIASVSSLVEHASKE